MLKTARLLKRFGTDTVAVDDVTVSVPPGQMVGIIGRSGAGKSTFLRLINRLIDPSEGRVEYDGIDVTRLKGRALREWRAGCAMIFQQFNLVGRLDVITNVLIGRIGYRGTLPTLFKQFSRAERAFAARALDRLELAERALQRADTLSGGQQQRVAIARALVQKPQIILADEPIASLDPANAKRVMDALRRINREDGITVLCNLHHLDTARTCCDRILGMNAGRLVFDAEPAALTAAVVQELFGEEAAEVQLPETETFDPRRRPEAFRPASAVA
jgi:phosphonate transport system ATP-binding protein